MQVLQRLAALFVCALAFAGHASAEVVISQV